MDRRKFIKSLLAGAAGVAAAAVIDPEELLWSPGKKAFSKPPAPKSQLTNYYYGKISASPGYTWEARYLTIEDFSERYIHPAIQALADKIDASAMQLYLDIGYNASVVKTATEAQARMNLLQNQNIMLQSPILEAAWMPKNEMLLVSPPEPYRVDVIYGGGFARINHEYISRIVDIGE